MMQKVLLLAACAASAVASPVSPDGRALLRHPHSIEEARSWHKLGMKNARKNAKSKGHHFMPNGAVELKHQQAVGTSTTGRVFSPVDFNADPTGTVDSTQAVTAALNALLSIHTNTKMAANIRDMGGATLDLRGGTYLISSPLYIPTFVGNLRVTGGTLRASANFTKNGFLLNIGADDCKTDSQGSCNEEVSVTSMMFDAAHVARGGLYVSHTMGTVVTDSFFTRFTGFGIQVTAGHELMVSYCWFSEYYWSDQHPTTNSVGLELNGNDNYIINVIVFDYTRTGVIVNGAANVLSSVHTWNGGGVGISLGTSASNYGAHQNRIEYCYLDYNTLDAYEPSDLVVTDTFFLDTHMNIMGEKINGLRLTQNSFTQPQTVVLNGSFTESSVNDVVVEGVQPSLQTQVTKAVTSDSAWKVDFKQYLLFPWIKYIQYSVAAQAEFSSLHIVPSYAVVNGTTVEVFIQNQGDNLTVYITAMQ